MHICNKYKVYVTIHIGRKAKIGPYGPELIYFVCEGKEEKKKYVQFEVSMTVCMGRTANHRKVPK